MVKYFINFSLNDCFYGFKFVWSTFKDEFHFSLHTRNLESSKNTIIKLIKIFRNLQKNLKES